MTKKIAIASDHAGFELKESIKKKFPEIEWEDLGPHSAESVNYPDYAQKLCKWVLDHHEEEALHKPCAILMCGSGQGMAMTANRYYSIRAALCWSEEVAKLSRQHNASNVLCLGARVIEESLNHKIVKTWFDTAFEGGRHLARIEKIDEDDCCSSGSCEH